jgi:hypothetical protein
LSEAEKPSSAPKAAELIAALELAFVKAGEPNQAAANKEASSIETEEFYRETITKNSEQSQLEYRMLINENERLLINLRKKYGDTIVSFLWIYFIFTVNCILFSAIGLVSIDPAVLAAIVGGTAVSVLGVVGTVAAGLFKTSK